MALRGGRTAEKLLRNGARTGLTSREAASAPRLRAARPAGMYREPAFGPARDGTALNVQATMKSLLPGAERPVVQFEHVGMRYGLGPEVLSDVSFRIAPHPSNSSPAPRAPARRRCCGSSCSPSARRAAHRLDLRRGGLRHLQREAHLLRRRMGVVFQDFRRLLDHLTTYENVALPLRCAGPLGDELPRRGGGTAALGRARRADARAPSPALRR